MIDTERKRVSSLQGVTLKSGRRKGNSTRVVDNAIQIIFDGGVCICEDTWECGQNRMANVSVYERIIKRLENEHQSVFKDRILLDRNKLEIALKNESEI